MAIYTVNISSAGSSDVVSLTDGSTYATLEVSAGKGPKGDGWTGVSYDTNTGRFTFTSNDGLGYVSDDITADLDAAVAAAQAAQSGAEGAEAATEALFDQFGDQYLGPKASDPTVDNDGDPLTAGDIYFNTTDSVLKFYSGSAWVAPESIATTAASDAQAAQAAAETAETNAETAQTAAEAAETNAAASETAAAGSAAAASTSADEAAASAASINLNSIDINGGTIDGTVIGGTTPAAGNFTTGSFTGNVTFDDNDKAIFGAGSDLQIYHDGSNSYIKDNGNGDLILQAYDDIKFQQATDNASLVTINTGGNVTIHGGDLDVTGTVTSDGLTVDGAIAFNSTATFADGSEARFGADNDMALFHSGGVNHIRVNSGTFKLRADDMRFTAQNGTFNKLTLDSNGDISFYEDTGTTPKFFWDASAESLGIGTSSPNYNLTSYKVGANANYIQVTNGSTGPNAANGTLFGVDASGNGVVTVQGSFDYITSVAGSEAMRISSSGFVGINETSPATELDVNGTTTSNQYLLDNIAKDISDTAVDVFVYDTSRDSDGGKWRKRTQHTSWYNETLNTATRGSRREFPAVAVIVAESNQVTIYDGDDPDLPMWMVFDVSPYDLLNSNAASSGNVTSVAALNGFVTVSKSVNYGSVPQISFIEDTGYFYHSVAGTYRYLGNISQRNDAKGGTAINANTIVNPYVNDVAMTVLPNAPIDAATGLPVPTIAVATNGGTSVIKDDGTVVDVLTSSGQSIEVSYNQDDYLWVTGGGGVSWQNWLFKTTPTSDGQSPDFTFNNGSTPPRFGSNGSYSINKQDQLGETVAFGKTNATSGPAVHLLNDTKMVAFIDPTYNTGWMNGDIKLATLSDTDDTDVTGSELVTNGTFDSDTTGWTAAFSNISVTGGTLQVVGTSNFNYATQTATGLTVGKKYVFQADIVTGSGNTYIYVRRGDNGGGITNGSANGVGSYALTFEAPTTSVEIRLYQIYQTTSTFDNVSLRLAEEDRSVNGNGLQVFGSITKDPVASGADLVAYGPFTSSNYLRQPYNSDLDLGTGDLAVTLWFKTSGSGYLYERMDAARTGNRLRGFVNGTNIQFFIGSGTGINAARPLADGVWHHYCGVIRNGQMFLYIDGVEVGNTSASSLSVTNTNATLTLGARSDDGTALNGSLSLFRFSATAPSPEQIAKIYNDEKVLFQENAQATLYGSSDAVTALAYDDTTELLHVGTSAGRSVFQGLRRVDNTTDAVGAAISASNGLVAED